MQLELIMSYLRIIFIMKIETMGSIFELVEYATH